MGSFSLHEHGRHYDYVLVQGKHRDPIKPGRLATGETVTKVHEAGRWRLYRVERPPAGD
jgi:hypothetical protein